MFYFPLFAVGKADICFDIFNEALNQHYIAPKSALYQHALSI